MSWLHAYSLKFGGPVPVDKLTGENGSFSQPVDIGGNVEKNKNKTNGYELKEHQITFNINKDNNKEPNRAEIKIINASDNLVNYINNNVKNSIAIVLDAGFKDEPLKRLFSGTVSKISDQKQGEDRETTLILKDGAINVQESLVSRSYPKGTKYKTIFEDMTKDLGVPVGSITLDSSSETTISPVSFVGSTAKAISNLAESINHNFSIQDGAAYITGNQKRPKNSVLLVSSETGLMGSPEPLSLEEKKSKKNKNPKDGIKFSMVLNGTLLPETTIFVKSKNYNSFFKVIKVVHKGDYENDEWTTDVEATYVDQTTK